MHDDDEKAAAMQELFGVDIITTGAELVLHCRSCDEQWLVPFALDDPSEPAAGWMLCPNGCNAHPLRPGDQRKLAIATEVMAVTSARPYSSALPILAAELVAERVDEAIGAQLADTLSGAASFVRSRATFV